MIDSKIVKNYASCLFNNVEAMKTTMGDHATTIEQMLLLSQLLETPQTRLAFCSPINSLTHKLNLVRALGKKIKFTKLVNRFLMIMAKNARFNILPNIIQEYQKLVAENANIKTVKVRAAHNPSKKELNMLKKYFESGSKNTVEFEITLDESLIGGAVVTCDSLLYDFSIAGAIHKIRKQVVAINL